MRKRHYVISFGMSRAGRLVYLSNDAAKGYREDALELGLGTLNGPFRSKGSAVYYRDYLATNQNVRCVADAERIYRRSKELAQSLASE